MSAAGELVIYPAVDPVQLPAAAPGRTAGMHHIVGRGHGDEFLGLRLMRPGEDPRDVHWRKTAALGQLVMRERARETRPDVKLSLDTVRPDRADEDWNAAFERRIREVASRAIAHLKRGDHVTIVTSAGGTARADRAVGADPLLRYLALLEPTTRPTHTPLVTAAE